MLIKHKVFPATISSKNRSIIRTKPKCNDDINMTINIASISGQNQTIFDIDISSTKKAISAQNDDILRVNLINKSGKYTRSSLSNIYRAMTLKKNNRFKQSLHKALLCIKNSLIETWSWEQKIQQSAFKRYGYSHKRNKIK